MALSESFPNSHHPSPVSYSPGKVDLGCLLRYWGGLPFDVICDTDETGISPFERIRERRKEEQSLME